MAPSQPAADNEKAHPALRLRIKVTLPTLGIDFFDYTSWQDPPLLFRKEQFLHADHPLREKFSRLTRQEEKRGLLEQIDDSAPASRWQMRLTEAGLAVRGHRLVHARLRAHGQMEEPRRGTATPNQHPVRRSSDSHRKA